MAERVEALAPVAVSVEELPTSIVRRLVKEKLSRLRGGGLGGGGGEEEADVTLHKEAILAFSESARIFIHYLSATANDICRESKRQIINAEDVFKALEEIEFSEFIDPLRVSLDEETVIGSIKATLNIMALGHKNYAKDPLRKGKISS